LFILKACSELPQLVSIPEQTIHGIRHLVQGVETADRNQRPELDGAGLSDVLLDLKSLCDRFSKSEKRSAAVEWLEKPLVLSPDVRIPQVNITNARDMTSMAIKAADLVRSLAAEHQAETLELLAESRFRGGGGFLGPCVVAAVILQADQSLFHQCPRLAEQLSSVASLDHIAGNSQWRKVLLGLENAKLALEFHPKIVNQATIDALLSNINHLLSSSSERSLDLHDESADLIFNRICDLLVTILSRFRRRLADRHHLLLAVLQQLLRSLFYPGSTNLSTRRVPVQGSNPTGFLNSLPRWLRTSKDFLPPSSAANYSRILSSICNPTVSAAKSSRKRGGSALNDETKQVRALAGQHMQYLVMEYARCSLDGEIRPHVKEKLIPGLYSVLDAMSRDLMRGMNAAMDPSSRAIFKALYDDWTRYGKWDKT
jgi:nucleolar pre-ribosomal-associated protein 2